MGIPSNVWVIGDPHLDNPTWDRLFKTGYIDATGIVRNVLPGEQPVNWRCDPIPLILSAEEFAGLEAGLAQRARLIDAILADIYGPGSLVETGAIPPDLVYGNPAFLRPWVIHARFG